MRTNVDINDRLMSDDLAASGSKASRDEADLGLQQIIQLKQQEELRRLRGKVDWQGKLDEMRRDA